MNKLSDYTQARVSLGVTGDSLPTQPLLNIRLAQARARDAVQFPLDSASLVAEMAQRNWSAGVLRSDAKDRGEYLRRPDKGRTLSADSAAEVGKFRAETVFVVADGLSALAVHRHAVPLLETLGVEADETNPIWIVQQGRVAISDHIGSLTDAQLAVILIGERPGLSTPDSLGVYLTWNPELTRTDAERNCVSNIHAQGLSYEVAAHKLRFLMREARRRQLTGVALKETAPLLLKNEAG